MSMMSIGLAVHVSEWLSVPVYDLEARVYGFNGPWWREASHLRSCRKGRGAPMTQQERRSEKFLYAMKKKCDDLSCWSRDGILNGGGGFGNPAASRIAIGASLPKTLGLFRV